MNEELKDSRIEGTQASGNDVPLIQTDQTPIPPQEKATLSAQKLEANKKNAQKSTGPRTEAGKAKSATNSYQHGFFAKHLFPTAEQAAKDKSDYWTVANGVYDHYQPVGFMENFWVEKIAMEAVRLARVVGYEQKVMMAWRCPFWSPAADKILRYQTTGNRRLTEAIEELERLQAKRKSETTSLNLLRSEASDTTAEPEASTSSAVGCQVDEQSTDEAASQLGSATPAIKGPGYSAAPENCGTNPPSSAGVGESTASAAQDTP